MNKRIINNYNNNYNDHHKAVTEMVGFTDREEFLLTDAYAVEEVTVARHQEDVGVLRVAEVVDGKQNLLFQHFRRLGVAWLNPRLNLTNDVITNNK
jgi:hypothetical protein